MAFYSDMILFMISIFVFLLGSVFAFVCLQHIGHYHLVFGYEFLAFLYLVSRLLSVDMFAYFNVRKPTIL